MKLTNYLSFKNIFFASVFGLANYYSLFIKKGIFRYQRIINTPAESDLGLIDAIVDIFNVVSDKKFDIKNIFNLVLKLLDEMVYLLSMGFNSLNSSLYNDKKINSALKLVLGMCHSCVISLNSFYPNQIFNANYQDDIKFKNIVTVLSIACSIVSPLVGFSLTMYNYCILYNSGWQKVTIQKLTIEEDIDNNDKTHLTSNGLEGEIDLTISEENSQTNPKIKVEEGSIAIFNQANKDSYLKYAAIPAIAISGKVGLYLYQLYQNNSHSKSI